MRPSHLFTRCLVLLRPEPCDDRRLPQAWLSGGPPWPWSPHFCARHGLVATVVHGVPMAPVAPSPAQKSMAQAPDLEDSEGAQKGGHTCTAPPVWCSLPRSNLMAPVGFRRQHPGLFHQ